MDNGFFAMISRMKYIDRWALMRNEHRENLTEHSFEVAVISHALAEIGRKRFGKQLARPNGGKQIAVAPEILLQDLCLAGQKNPGKRNSVSRTQQKLSAPEA